MTTINPEWIKQVAGAGGGQGLPAGKQEVQISAPPAHPPHVSRASAQPAKGSEPALKA